MDSLDFESERVVLASSMGRRCKAGVVVVASMVKIIKSTCSTSPAGVPLKSA